MLKRPLLAMACMIALAGTSAAATEVSPASQGERFRPLADEELNPDQKRMADNILSGARGRLSGPFNVLMRSPAMGDLAQKLGEQVRYRSSLPRKLNEMAILLVGAKWRSEYEWYVHAADAKANGLDDAVIEAIRQRTRPAALSPDEAVVFNFANELLETTEVSDASFKALVDRFGEQGATDLIATLGYYTLVCMVLNVDRYPIPAEAAPQFGAASQAAAR